MNAVDVHAVWGFHEPLSSWSHLLAMPVFAVLGYCLVRRGRGNWARSTSLTILVVATLFLLSMSTVYHLLAPGTARSVMRQLDISAVFVLIAGTATPVHVVLFQGIRRWLPLLIIWSVAVIGILVRLLYRDRLPYGVGNGIFLAMGWGGLTSCIALARRYGYAFVRPLVWGGIAYTVGVVILGMHWPTLIPGVITSHELWHVAVLLGLSLHWRFVFQFAAGPPTAHREGPDREASDPVARQDHHETPRIVGSTEPVPRSVPSPTEDATAARRPEPLSANNPSWVVMNRPENPSSQAICRQRAPQQADKSSPA